MRTPRVTLRLALAAGIALLALTPMLASAYDWEQFDGSSQHSGNNTSETIINHTNVVGLQQAFQTSLPSNDTADGAPVYLSNVVTTTGTVNTVFVTTRGGRIVALNADTGATIWTRRPATSPNYTTSSPVIDPNHQFVYSYGLEGKVHKYNVSTGAETIDANWPELATRKPDVEKGSSALSTATAHDGIPRLYVTNGGYPGDAGDYQGHVTAINLNTGAQNVFNMACSNLAIHFIENGTPGVDDCATPQNALWARPGIVYDPVTDRIYFTGSNGHYSGNTGGFDWSETTMALNPDATSNGGVPLDSYTPTNFQQLDDTDADIGSTNPVLLPAPAGSIYPHLAAQSGKDGKIRLLNLDNMSGQGGPRHIGGELQLINVPVGSTTLPSPAVWVNPADGGIWYIISNYSGIAGMQLIADCSGQPRLVTRWNITPGNVTSPLVANGVLFYAYDGNIVAADPTNGHTLWSDTGIGGIHWESPVVVNGMLYITDGDGHITAYHINATVPTVVPVTNTPRATSTPCAPTHTPTPAPTHTPAPPSPTPPCPVPFVDIQGNIFYGSIVYLYCQHVVNGTDATHYSPAGTSTRGQFAKVVVLGFGISFYTPSGVGHDFTDVPSTYFAYLYIESGFHAGILSGFDAATCTASGLTPPCYMPNRAITRGQITKLVVSAAGYALYTPALGPDFTDVPPSNIFYASIETAFHKGVVGGYPDNTFRPNNNVRRDEMAQIVYKGITTPLAADRAGSTQKALSLHGRGLGEGKWRSAAHRSLPPATLTRTQRIRNVALSLVSH